MILNKIPAQALWFPTSLKILSYRAAIECKDRNLKTLKSCNSEKRKRDRCIRKILDLFILLGPKLVYF